MSVRKKPDTNAGWRSGWRRLTRIWKPETVANIDDELRFHFEQKIAEFEAQGMTAARARIRAEEEFGDMHQVKTSLREIDERMLSKQQRAEWWESVAQDLQYVVRSLRRSPGFTMTVVLTLALGLGANAAIFSFLDRLYFQPPAGTTDPGSLRRVYIDAGANAGAHTRSMLSLPELKALREVAPAGVTLAGYSTSKVLLGRNSNAAEARATYVEGDYFGVLGVAPMMGRKFSPDEYRVEGQAMVAVISHALWQQHFGGDAEIIGKDIDLGSHRHVIIGVAPDRFRGVDLNVSDVWVPRNTEGSLNARQADWYTRKDQISMQVVARIADAGTVGAFNQRATQSLRDIRSMGDSLETTRFGSFIESRGGASNITELKIATRLAGVAAVILLIACANVVNLLLARASTRQREVAVRLALGVSRRRLMSQLLTESSVLSLFSVLVALAVAYMTSTALQKLLMPGVLWGESVLNLRVVAFTTALALVTGIVAGLAPAWQATNPNLSGALKTSVRDGGRRGSSTRATLLVAQTALSMVLLAGAGVFVRSMAGVAAIDTGYADDRIVYANIRHDRDLQNRDAEIQRGMPDVAQRIRSLPGVEKVALSSYAPMNGMSWTSLFMPDRDSLPSAEGMQRILYNVSPEFFETVGIRILRGRSFTDADVSGGELVIAINETMANNLWPGEDPLSKCLIMGKRESLCRRVVAVVSPAHFNALIEGPSMLYYTPLAQSGRNALPGFAGEIVVRTADGTTGAVANAMRRELSTYFGSWARPNVRTMKEILDPQMRPWRTGAVLFSAAGVLALIVAAIGTYSSIAYSVSQRTREMGVRVALGANSASIVQIVVSQGLRIVAAGVVAGLLLALALGSLVASMLYETSPRDVTVLVASSTTLLLVALLACAVPAWRASRVDPLHALKAE